MFDVAGSELLVVFVVALLVVGPRDLPELLRKAGRFSANLRAMVENFRRQLEAPFPEPAPEPPRARDDVDQPPRGTAS